MVNDSLAYSESEALQFSHPPKESRGPPVFELSPERPGLGVTLSEECLAEHGFELKIPPLQSAGL